MREVEAITRFVYNKVKESTSKYSTPSCIVQITCIIDDDGMKTSFAVNKSNMTYGGVTSFNPAEAIQELARRCGWANTNEPVPTKLLIEAAPDSPPLSGDDEILF